jgi:L-lactate dehydrogenase
MQPFAEHTILLLVANPVDVITYFAQQYSNLPKSQVIGSGTFLDSARLRGILAATAEVSASSIDAYVLGEHGESQFVAWSAASIGGVSLSQTLPPNTKFDKDAIAEDTKNKASNIIANKGATNYGIGAVTASICKSILSDLKNIRPVSHYQEDLGVCLSMPAVIGRRGLVRTIEMGLDEEEMGKLRKSAETLKEIINA